MAEAKVAKLVLKSSQRHPNADAIIAAVERDGGVEDAIDAACHLLDVAVDYLVQKRGAAYVLNRFVISRRIGNALIGDIKRF